MNFYESEVIVIELLESVIREMALSESSKYILTHSLKFCLKRYMYVKDFFIKGQEDE